MNAVLHARVGEYELTDFLGAGGAGEVYRAVHAKIGRIVAVKVLSRSEPGQNAAERFLNEARIQAGLCHPHIAQFYDFADLDGRACIIMEYVEGPTLHEHLHGRALPVSDALHIAVGIAKALAYVHEHGIVHRDLKAENIKITSRGPMLLDFGIARDDASRALTRVDSCLGTVAYASPEQLKGARIDARSDIWSFGVLLYEMVTGHLPYTGDSTAAICMKILQGPYTPPGALERVIARCLSANAQARYKNGTQLLEDLLAFSSTAEAPVYMKKGRDLVLAASVAGMTVATFLAICPFTWTRSPTTPAASSAARESSVLVKSIDGTAEVYERGELKGETPYRALYPVGTEVRLLLKRGDETDCLRFVVSTLDDEYDATLKNVIKGKPEC